jgi:hypothetical protein
VDGRQNALHLGSYQVRLEDATGNGNEIVIVVEPEAGRDGNPQNQVRVCYYPKDRDDTEFAAQQTAALGRKLSAAGLMAGGLQAAPGFEGTHRGSDSSRDFNAIRRQSPVASKTVTS